jgi:transcriptional regulator with XRE-family HTH domain
MDLIDRFKYLMKLNNLTASSFADEIGVQRSSMSHILSGRNKPSLEFIQKVIIRFPKVNADWLISGVSNIEKMDLPDNQKDVVEKKASSPTLSLNSNTAIKKIVVFYEDNTFEEFYKG